MFKQLMYPLACKLAWAYGWGMDGLRVEQSLKLGSVTLPSGVNKFYGKV